jgi:hypothetical protein
MNKEVYRSLLQESNTHGRAVTTKPLITESNAQMGKGWCHDHRTWISDNWKCARDMVRRVILHAVPYMRRSLHLENTRGRLQSGVPGSNSDIRGG